MIMNSQIIERRLILATMESISIAFYPYKFPTAVLLKEGYQINLGKFLELLPFLI